MNERKLTVKQVIMTQEIPKRRDSKLGTSKILSILPENSAGGLGSTGNAAGVTNEKLVLKSIFSLEVATTLLTGSRKGAVAAK